MVVVIILDLKEINALIDQTKHFRATSLLKII